MWATITGVVTIVQEGRFQITDDDGVSHLFILGASSTAETNQLPILQKNQSRVRVSYQSSPNLIANRVSALYVDD